MTQIKQLQTLQLNLGDNDIKPATLTESTAYLQSLQNLKSLSISLFKDRYENNFYTQLSSLSQLKELGLILRPPSVPGQTVFADALKSLQPLNKLHLCFISAARDDTVFYSNKFNILCKSISVHAKTLRSLRLTVLDTRAAFPSWTRLPTSDIPNRFVELNNLLLDCKKLQKLSLCFSDKYDNQDFLNLPKALSQLTTLKTLFLSIEGAPLNEKDTENFFELLAATLGQNPGLNKVSIFLKDMELATDEDIKKMSEHISCLKNLKKVVFQFRKFSKITATGLEALLGSAKASPRLEEALFSFVGKTFGDFTLRKDKRTIMVFSKPIFDPMFDFSRMKAI